MSLAYAFPKTRATGGPEIINFGDIFAIPVDITGDSSYPSGGYSFGAPLLGKFPSRRIIGAEQIGWGASSPPAGVGSVAWDTVNSKLTVRASGGITPFIIEEDVVITAGVGRLASVPAYIVIAHASAGDVTGALRIIPVGETPATTQMAVNFATGAVATNVATDALTAIKVTYIPLGVGPFIEANRVVDEVNTGTNDTTRDLAFRASLIQYLWNDTAGTLPTLVPTGESPGSGEAAIDVNNSNATTITVNAAQDDANYKITYWKFSAIGLAYGATEETDLTITTNALVFPSFSGIWIPGFGNVLVGEDSTTNRQLLMLGPSGAAATLVAKYDLPKKSLVFDTGDSMDTLSVPWIVLDPAQMGGTAGQVPAGANLSAMVVRMMVYGR